MYSRFASSFQAHLQWHSVLLCVAVTWTPATAKCMHKVTEEETEAEGSRQGSDTGVYPHTLPGQFSRLFTLLCNCNSTDSSSFYHSIKSSGATTKCFLTALLSAQGFLKGSCNEVFWSDIINYPKAAEGIKRLSSKPSHSWTVGIFPGTQSLRCLRIAIDVSTEGTFFPPESALPGAML